MTLEMWFSQTSLELINCIQLIHNLLIICYKALSVLYCEASFGRPCTWLMVLEVS